MSTRVQPPIMSTCNHVVSSGGKFYLYPTDLSIRISKYHMYLSSDITALKYLRVAYANVIRCMCVCFFSSSVFPLFFTMNPIPLKMQMLELQIIRSYIFTQFSIHLLYLTTHKTCIYIDIDIYKYKYMFICIYIRIIDRYRYISAYNLSKRHVFFLYLQMRGNILNS